MPISAYRMEWTGMRWTGIEVDKMDGGSLFPEPSLAFLVIPEGAQEIQFS